MREQIIKQKIKQLKKDIKFYNSIYKIVVEPDLRKDIKDILSKKEEEKLFYEKSKKRNSPQYP
jgi:rubrerythrin